MVATKQSSFCHPKAAYCPLCLLRVVRLFRGVAVYVHDCTLESGSCSHPGVQVQLFVVIKSADGWPGTCGLSMGQPSSRAHPKNYRSLRILAAKPRKGCPQVGDPLDRTTGCRPFFARNGKDFIVDRRGRGCSDRESHCSGRDHRRLSRAPSRCGSCIFNNQYKRFVCYLLCTFFTGCGATKPTLQISSYFLHDLLCINNTNKWHEPFRHAVFSPPRSLLVCRTPSWCFVFGAKKT